MPLLTVRDAASRVGVSYSTFKQWIYKGSVRSVQTNGGHHRISETEINRLLAQRNLVPRRKTLKAGALVSLSGRNRLRGIVEEVRREGLLAQI